jgi:putative salt-induced outer membrane protein
MRNSVKVMAAIVLLSMMCPAAARAQAPAGSPPPPPPPPLSGNFSVGLGVTSGNSDTTNFNGSYEVKFDPKTRNVLKSNGLFLYGKTNGTLSTEQYGLLVRDEYSFGPRAFAFGEVRYLHDRFKGISYLLSPTFGAGYKVVEEKTTSLSVSAGVGSVSEKDYGFATQTTGAVSFEEKLTHKLSSSAAVGQSVSALWHIGDFGNGLYLAGVNLTSTLVGRAQLKIEVLDSYRTRPSLPTLRRNDVAFLMGIVFKF